MLARYPAVDAAACVAFGDHPSDLPMMRAVGHAVAVGDDPEVVAFARGRTAAAVRLPGAGTAADRG
ncbi:HAD hydrolase family protein [Streptacidiphilus monticola]